MLRKVDIPLDKGLVDDELRRYVRELRLAPSRNLLRHRIEVPLHFRNADVERVDQVEILGVLGEHRREVTGECHVVAHEDAIADGHREPHGFVMGVSDTEGKAAALERGFELHDAEHLHAVL